MVEIGRLWQSGKISVAAEHTASTIVQFVVTALYPLMTQATVARGTVVVAGVAGEQHQLGAHLVSDALEADGWQVRFLGANCSIATIVSAVSGERAHVVALSCTMPENIAEVERVVHATRLHVTHPALRVIVGGQAFGEGPRAVQRALSTGADAFASNLRQAVLTARPWSIDESQHSEATHDAA